jgi:hypothetical protein
MDLEGLFVVLFLVLCVGFVGGYGVREYISRRHRAAFKKFLEERYEEKRIQRPLRRTDPVLLAKLGIDLGE